MTNQTKPAAATKTRALTWKEFERRLAVALRAMADGTFLILTERPGDGSSGYYVQFAQDGAPGFRAEAVGNRHLPSSQALTTSQEEQLVKLGWQPPEPGENAGPNYFRQLSAPAPFAEVAEFAVRTLRDVYRITGPAALEYVYQSFNGDEVVEPDLGIDRRSQSRPTAPAKGAGPAATDLRSYVEAAMRKWLRVERLVRDDEGDYPVRMGSAMIFIRLLAGKPPLVRVFSPVLHHIGESPALLAELNEINSKISFGRVFWTGRQVIVAMELTALDLTADQIAFACIELGSLADHLDDGLHGRFGGATMFRTAVELVN